MTNTYTTTQSVSDPIGAHPNEGSEPDPAFINDDPYYQNTVTGAGYTGGGLKRLVLTDNTMIRRSSAICAELKLRGVHARSRPRSCWIRPLSAPRRQGSVDGWTPSAWSRWSIPSIRRSFGGSSLSR